MVVFLPQGYYTREIGRSAKLHSLKCRAQGELSIYIYNMGSNSLFDIDMAEKPPAPIIFGQTLGFNAKLLYWLNRRDFGDFNDILQAQLFTQ